MSLILLLLLASACNVFPPVHPPSTATSTPEIVIEIDITYVSPTSIPEAAEYSEIIVIGKVNSLHEFLDCAHKMVDLCFVDEVHEILVEQYLKGEGPESILFAHHEGLIPLELVPSPSIDDMLEAREKVRGKMWLPLTPDHTYLMFLNKSKNANSYTMNGRLAENLHYRSVSPGIFDLANPNQVVLAAVPTDLKFILNMFPPIPLDEMIELIHTPYMPPTPYPTAVPAPEYPAYPGPYDSPPNPPAPYPSP